MKRENCQAPEGIQPGTSVCHEHRSTTASTLPVLKVFNNALNFYRDWHQFCLFGGTTNYSVSGHYKLLAETDTEEDA